MKLKEAFHEIGNKKMNEKTAAMTIVVITTIIAILISIWMGLSLNQVIGIGMFFAMISSLAMLHCIYEIRVNKEGKQYC